MMTGTDVVIQIQNSRKDREYLSALVIIRDVIQNGLGCFVGPIVFVDNDPVPQSAMMRYDISDKGDGDQPASQVLLIEQSEFLCDGIFLRKLVINIGIQL